MIALFALSVIAAAPAGAADCRITPYQATATRLGNGLQVVVVPTGQRHVASLQVVVGASPRYETAAGNSGLAKAIERLVATRNSDLPAAARQTSVVADDLTRYETVVPITDLAKVIDAEAQRIQRLEMTEPAYRNAARSIQSEYRKLMKSPVFRLFETQRQKTLPKQPYGHGVYGTRADVEDLPNEYVAARAFFERWYRPDTTTLIVAGDVDPALVLPVVEKSWGSWTVASQPSKPVAGAAPLKGPVTTHLRWENETAPLIAIAFRGPAFDPDSTDFAALQTAVDLYFGAGSELRHRLVDEEENVERMGVEVAPMADAGLATIYARLYRVQDLAYVRDEILATAARARSELPAPERLIAVRANFRFTLLQNLETTQSTAALLAQYAVFGSAYEALDRYACTRNGVTAEDVRAAAQKYFTEAGLVVTALSHEQRPRDLPALPSVEHARDEAVESNATATEIPLVRVQPEAGIVHVDVRFAAGSGRDPIGKEGLASLAASLVANSGSRTLSPDETRRSLFASAGNITSIVSREITTFTLSAHRENISALLDIALPMLAEPKLRREELQHLRRDQSDALQNLIATDRLVSSEAIQQRAYHGRPYGHPVLGLISSIDTININDVRRFVRRYYTTANVSVAVSGAIPESDVARLRAALSGVAGPAAAPLPVALRPPLGIAIDVYDKVSETAWVTVGQPLDIDPSHRDYAAISVATLALDARMSQLMRERGSEPGSAVLLPDRTQTGSVRHGTVLQIESGSIAPDRAHMTIRTAIYALQKLVDGGLTDAEFEQARYALLSRIDFATADPRQASGNALDSLWYRGAGLDVFRAAATALTRAHVEKAMREHFHPGNLYVAVVVPDARKLRAELLGNKIAPPVYQTQVTPSVNSEDAAIAKLDLEIEKDNIRLMPITIALIE